ncbi:transcription regulator protein BACH1b isoform X2 [Cottoperca gobio]|uniref:Transcription regulator protein BACH1b isoform X2 n=1 Tax=Cottoperca gobio TaxID=56716 RepID=A0A6J2R454_COTGO|nr:transcription regulator protein BACH1-like isoform X2 [Cottoperca gobio]
MSLMATSGPRSSVFTFESTVHSSHVLRCLDEQRRRDMFCDVTVVVEGQSLRAHRSVLASCSEYFTHRISSLTQHGAVITLPQEVTVAGFEPLLKFAYTSKLLFGKDDVLEIRNSSSILGFRDLDEACFDFLLPKFFSSNGSAPVPRNTCCKKKCKRQLSKEDIDSDDVLLDEKDVKPVADSTSTQEVTWHCQKLVNSKMFSQNCTSTVTPEAEGTNDNFVQCPKYRKFQLACGKENCVTDKSLNKPTTVIRDYCDLSYSPCSSIANSKNETDVEVQGNSTSNSTRQSKGGADEPWKTEIPDKKTEYGGGRGGIDMLEKDTHERPRKWNKKEREINVEEDASSSDRSNVKAVSSGPCTVLGERSSGLILHHCPLKTFGEAPAITRALGHKRFVMDITEGKKTRESGALPPVSIHEKTEEQVEAEWKMADDEIDSGWQEKGSMARASLSVNNGRERSTVEREVAEDLAKRLGSDVSFPQLNFQHHDAGSSSDTVSGRAQSTSLDCLNFYNLSSTSTSCFFFQDLDQNKCPWKGAELSECEGASQSGVSSLNSGEDGESETETEGDSESYTRERARQVQLPFSVELIVDLSRNDFQQLLKQQVFTPEQLEFVHDMRRRSKNRLAAQRCRKRKLDCIYNLQCEINKLTEREKLMTEKSHLSQLKLKTRHSVSALCQRVCNEANLQPEQLQVLTKYTSPDCPLSSFSTHIDTLLSQPGLLLQPQALLSDCFVGLDK